MIVHSSRRTLSFPVVVSTILRCYDDLYACKTESMLEESARSYNEARIRPLTYVSVDQAYQAELVGKLLFSSSLICLFVALRFMSEKHVGKSPPPGRSASTSRNGFLAQIWSVHHLEDPLQLQEADLAKIWSVHQHTITI